MSSEAGSRPTTGSEDVRGRGAASARVGMFAPFDLLERGPEAARAFLAQAGEAGISHVCCGDHVSFAGAGFDGLVQAAALAMLHPTLPIYSGVYLLPLRHPVLVARRSRRAEDTHNWPFCAAQPRRTRHRQAAHNRRYGAFLGWPDGSGARSLAA